MTRYNKQSLPSESRDVKRNTDLKQNTDLEQNSENDTSVSPSTGCFCKQYVSDEETAVLRRMREIKNHATTIRHRLNQTDLTPLEYRELFAQLDDLRTTFHALRSELKEANRLKMLKLGHIP